MLKPGGLLTVKPGGLSIIKPGCLLIMNLGGLSIMKPGGLGSEERDSSSRAPPVSARAHPSHLPRFLFRLQGYLGVAEKRRFRTIQKGHGGTRGCQAQGERAKCRGRRGKGVRDVQEGGRRCGTPGVAGGTEGLGPLLPTVDRTVGITTSCVVYYPCNMVLRHLS